MSQRSFSRPGSVALATFLLLTGCSGSAHVLEDSNEAADAGHDAGDPFAGLPTVDVSMGPIVLAPGTESTVCVDQRLPTTQAIDVAKITTDLPLGGHHLIFYKSSATVENTTPTPCMSSVFGGDAPLLIAQKPHTELLFPRGVVYSLPAGQMVRMELHFLNTTDQPLPLTATVRLSEALSGTVTDHANLIFTGNLMINIPPQGTATVGPSTTTFGDRMPNIFGVTGHQHQRGTSFLIELGDLNAGSMKTIYDNHDWAEAPLTIFDPPLATKAGDGLRYTCTYSNPTNQPIRFGIGATDEMCFLWAYYYPDMGYNFTQ